MHERDLFIAAVQIDDRVERTAYLDRECAGDSSLRERVEALLGAFHQAGSFLQHPADSPATSPEGSPTAPGAASGTVIGPYKLLQQIGEGGMGAVWMAEQTQPVQRRVALKIIKPGMDSKQVLARFEAERQALALMDHPNIAKVHDAGTTPDGRPFFVMELVKGQPITKYCDEQRLTPRERLELFIPVCQATQHAHQKGIIHRDIKPSNVLVAPYDGKPVVKVIDFGIAKATGQRLTQKTLFTEFGSIVGTLEYMSPEQAELNNQDIDTRSDVYSLGVLLYELLTGTTPLDRARLGQGAFAELLRIIREEDPPRPSTRLSTTEELPAIAASRGLEPGRLTKLMRGELDWIVMKALEKDRSRRYESANAFARDVGRYLNDEPVQACPPSAGYRLRKFARRNRRALATATVITLAIILSVGALGWAVRDREARRSEAQRQQAEREAEAERERNQGAEDALNKAEFLRDRGDWAKAREAVKPAEWLLEGGGSDANRERVRQLLADLKMVSLLEEIRLGHDSPLPIRYLGDEFSDGPRSRQLEPLYLEAFKEYAIEVDALDVPTAAGRIKKSAIREQLLAALDDWMWVRLGPMSGGKRLLSLEQKRPDVNQEALIKIEALLREEGAKYDHLRAIADRVAPNEWSRRVRDPAVHNDRQALAELALRPEVASLPPSTATLLARLLNREGEVTKAVGVLSAVQQRSPDDFILNYELAILLYRQTEIGKARLEDVFGFLRVAVALRPNSYRLHYALGDLLYHAGRLDQAIVAYRKAVEINPRFSPAGKDLGRALVEKGDWEEVIAVRARALEASAEAGEASQAAALGALAAAYRGAGKWDKALASFREAARLAEATSLPSANDSAHRDLAWLLATCPDEKLRDPAEAVKLAAKGAERKPNDGDWLEVLGAARYYAGDFDGAVRALTEAEVANRRISGGGTRHGLLLLAMALWQRGEPQKAGTYYSMAIRRANPPPAGLPHTRPAREWQEERDRFRGEAAKLMGADPRLRQLDELIAGSRKALQMNPENVGARQSLGDALREKGLLDEAVAEYRLLVLRNPNDARAHRSLGNALADKGSLDEAVMEYRIALRLNSNDALAVKDLIRVLQGQKKFDEALAEYQKLISRYELAEQKSLKVPRLYEMGKALHDAAVALRDRGQPAEARQLLNLAIEIQAIVFQSEQARQSRLVLDYYRWALAETLVQLKQYATAAQEAASLDRGLEMTVLGEKPPADLLFKAARVWAALSGQVKGAEQEKQAARAAALLQQAREQGYFKNKAVFDSLKTDPAFDPLRQREDFKRLTGDGFAALGADGHYNEGLELEKTGKLDLALVEYQKAAREYEALIAKAPRPADLRGAGMALRAVAGILRRQGKAAEAREPLERAIRHQKAAVQAAPEEKSYPFDLWQHYQSLAETLLQLKEHAGAAKAVVEFPGILPDANWSMYRVPLQQLTRCVVLAENDTKLSEAERRAAAKGYTELARKLIQEGGAKLAAATPRPVDPKAPPVNNLAEAYLVFADVCLTLGDVATARELTRSALELTPDNLGRCLAHASVLLLADDAEGYRKLCRRVLEKFGQTKNPVEASLVARICTLGPDAVSDPAVVVALTEKGGENAPSAGGQFHRLGMAHYRAGRPEEAIKQFEQSLEVKPPWTGNVCNWLGLAAAHHHRGHTDEARKWLGKATTWIDENAVTVTQASTGLIRRPPRDDTLAWRVLHREVEKLLKKPSKEDK